MDNYPTASRFRLVGVSLPGMSLAVRTTSVHSPPIDIPEQKETTWSSVIKTMKQDAKTSLPVSGIGSKLSKNIVMTR